MGDFCVCSVKKSSNNALNVQEYLFYNPYIQRLNCRLLIFSHRSRYKILYYAWVTCGASRYYLFKRENEVLFSTVKNSPFPLAQSMKLQISAPVLISCHDCEKSTRESRNSHRLQPYATGRHPRENPLPMDPRGYMSSGWRNLF